MPRPLLAFHKRTRPPVSGTNAPRTTSAPLTEDTKRCLRNLTAHRRAHVPPAPRARSAAVLVALFIGRWGDLHVLLSQRANSMNSYAGDTALPGGRVDPQDRSLEDTARREAFEEIGLPRDKHRVPLLCTLEPFLARNKLVVTPIVVLITDQTLRPILNDAEVKTLFSHPLSGFLSEEAPRHPSTVYAPFAPDPIRPIDPLTQMNMEDLQIGGGFSPVSASEEAPTLEDVVQPLVLPVPGDGSQPDPIPYHTYIDLAAGEGNSPMRMHSFLTGREDEGVKPVYGLTSAIMIHAARIAYAPRNPQFEVNAPGQLPNLTRVANAMRNDPILREAALAEGLGRVWGLESTRGRGGQAIERLEKIRTTDPPQQKRSEIGKL
ncbi:NUDIX hydrolase domain-like protein [Auriculariales sp. MPI-PUGE-AT-0066]|nr:NUDIX hydrolase domain-like protein [Auriculariales sp. MPI-PUGE-AT-0066]